MITKETSASKLGFAFLATLLMLVLCSTSSFSRSIVSEVIVAQLPDTIISNLTNTKLDTAAVEIKAFIFYEVMPSFNYKEEHGIQAFANWVADNIKYPLEAKKNGIQGKVYVSFIIEIDGSVSNIKIVRGVYKLLDEEAIRVVSESPKWIPGKERGKLAPIPYTMPITFKLK